jgi:hypothetical protein
METVTNTIYVIGGGQKVINFLVASGAFNFINMLHLVSHLGKDEVRQLADAVNGLSALLDIITNLDTIGSMTGEHVDTFISFVEATGGIAATRDLFLNIDIDTNYIIKEFGHLLIHVCPNTFVNSMILFGGPAPLMAFIKAVGGVHKMCNFLKNYGPTEVSFLIVGFGSVEKLTRLTRINPGIFDSR